MFDFVTRRNLPRLEIGQRATGLGRSHQADRLRDVQGGAAPRRHDQHVLRNAQLHRSRDPTGRRLR